MAGIFPNGLKTLVAKAEIAGYEQCLLFSHRFQKVFIVKTRKNQGLFRKGLTK